MRQAALKSLYDLHSWIGLVLGLLLYLVCFSGTVALFDKELVPWIQSTPASAEAASPEALERALTLAREAGAGGRTVRLMLPTYYSPWLTLFYGTAESAGETSLRLDPASGALRTPRDSSANYLLRRLHTDLLLPSPWGRYVVGGLGLVMLLSLFSGFLLHRKPLAELFTLRLWRSSRLRRSDLHKALGLWSLPFTTIMALTGAVLGFAGLLLMLNAFLSFKGDIEAASAALMGPQGKMTEAIAPARPAAALLALAGAELEGLRPEQMIFRQLDRAGALVDVYGSLPRRLVYYPAVTLEADSGRTVAAIDWSRESLGKRLYAMVTPLHYGSYGGLPLKLLYALLGAGSCALIVSGLLIWSSRAPAASGRSGLAMLIAGGLFGLPFTSVALFCLDHLDACPPAPGDLLLFLGLWAGTLLWPLLRGARRGGRELLAATALILLAFPLLAFAIGGGESLGWPPQPTAIVNGMALLTGGLLLYWARRPYSSAG